ncbi:hypothetical protein IH776_27060 [Escherichia coli]|nr:hypothetical protein [Escherichia coli]
MNEILKEFTPNNVAGGSYERISIASLINNLDATKSVVLQRQKIVNDENGKRLETPIQLDDLRVDLTQNLLEQDVLLLDVLTGQPLNIAINGQMNMADAQSLLFNLIASFRIFLAMQQQQPPTDEPTI